MSGRLAFRLWPTLFTVPVFIILLCLGTWQVQRLHWKEDLIARVDACLKNPPIPFDALKEDDVCRGYRPVEVTGVFRHDGQILVHAMSLTGEAGYHVLTPFIPSKGKMALFVNRGWVASGKADFDKPKSRVTLRGVAALPPMPHWMQAENNPAKNDWYHVDPAAMAAAVGIKDYSPYILVADAVPGVQSPLGGQLRARFRNNHLAYAVTWYGLAAALLVIYGISSRRKVS